MKVITAYHRRSLKVFLTNRISRFVFLVSISLIILFSNESKFKKILDNCRAENITDYARFAERRDASLGPNFAKKTNKQEHKILLKFPIQENLQSRPVYKSKILFSKELESKM